MGEASHSDKTKPERKRESCLKTQKEREEEKMKRNRGKAFIVLAISASLVLCTGRLACGAEGMSAIEAFELLRKGEEKSQPETKRMEYLSQIMNGAYVALPKEKTELESFAEGLAILEDITNTDLAFYAAEHGLLAGQVRHAYYLALANTLRADILLHPAKEDQYKKTQLILSLFLDNGSEEGLAERELIRSCFTQDSSRQIADFACLPESFVEFLVMEKDWEDPAWENDFACRQEINPSFWSEDPFSTVMIGDQDGEGREDIANMQSILIQLGYLNGTADGIFGPRTQAALLEFQLANGMAPTGSYTSLDHHALCCEDAVARWDYGKSFYDEDTMISLSSSFGHDSYEGQEICHDGSESCDHDSHYDYDSCVQDSYYAHDQDAYYHDSHDGGSGHHSHH